MTRYFYASGNALYYGNEKWLEVLFRHKERDGWYVLMKRGLTPLGLCMGPICYEGHWCKVRHIAGWTPKEISEKEAALRAWEIL